MSDLCVYDVGRIPGDIDERPCVVGVDYDSIFLGYIPGAPVWRFTREQAEQFAHLLVAACWEAGNNVAAMRFAGLPLYGEAADRG